MVSLCGRHGCFELCYLSKFGQSFSLHNFSISNFQYLFQGNASPTPTDQSEQHALELDLEHYEVPPPGSVFQHGVYAADATELPRGNLQRSASVPITAPFYGESRKYKLRQGNVTPVSTADSNEKSKERGVSVKVMLLSFRRFFSM